MNLNTVLAYRLMNYPSLLNLSLQQLRDISDCILCMEDELFVQDDDDKYLNDELEKHIL